MVLSIRRARIKGFLRNSPSSSALPAITPACGPPSSLSPLKQTRSTPCSSEAFTLGSISRTGWLESDSRPLPTSWARGMSARAASWTSSARVGDWVNPTIW